MMGDKVEARKSCEDLLTLWKDADPDIGGVIPDINNIDMLAAELGLTHQASVPELPTSLMLLGGGLLGAACKLRRSLRSN